MLFVETSFANSESQNGVTNTQGHHSNSLKPIYTVCTYTTTVVVLKTKIPTDYTLRIQLKVLIKLISPQTGLIGIGRQY